MTIMIRIIIAIMTNNKDSKIKNSNSSSNDNNKSLSNDNSDKSYD